MRPEREKNTDIPPGKVGIVTALGGKPLPPGRVLAEKADDPRTKSRASSARCCRRARIASTCTATKSNWSMPPRSSPALSACRAGCWATTARAALPRSANEKGILREVLQPGLYYINTKEFEVIKAEVGIFQTAFRYDRRPEEEHRDHVHLQGRLSDQHGLHRRMGSPAGGHAASWWPNMARGGPWKER